MNHVKYIVLLTGFLRTILELGCLPNMFQRAVMKIARRFKQSGKFKDCMDSHGMRGAAGNALRASPNGEDDAVLFS